MMDEKRVLEFHSVKTTVTLLNYQKEFELRETRI